MKKTAVCSLTAIIMSAVLAGCGMESAITIDKETDKEEYDKVIAYSAEMLMKHSYNLVDDLTYVAIPNSEKPNSLIGDENSSESSQNAFNDVSIAQESSTQEALVQESAQEPPADDSGSNEAQNAESTEPTADTGEASSAPVPDATEQASVQVETPDNQDESVTAASDDAGAELSTEAPDETEELNTPDESLMDIQKALSKELGGLNLMYNGYSVVNAYPSMLAQGGIVAAKGEKVLVINFTLVNSTGSPVNLDILDRGIYFKVLLNGKTMKYAEVTMLPDDLRGYSGNVKAGSEQNVVLLETLKESETANIKTLGLEITSGQEHYDVTLQ
jgi:hypothetical protein